MRTDVLRVDGGRPAVALVAALPASWTTEADRLVLLALACDSFDGQTSAPGADNLAAWTGLHRGTVYDVVRRLQSPTSIRPALVAVADTRRGRRRTRYRLTLPDVEPSSEADSCEPSGQHDGSAGAAVGQPSGDRPLSPTVEHPQPSANRPESTDTPSPSDSPSPTTDVDPVKLASGELVVVVVEAIPDNLRPDHGRLSSLCQRLADDGWTPDELRLWVKRQSWSGAGGPGLVVHRLGGLQPTDRQPSPTRPHRPSARPTCPNGYPIGVDETCCPDPSSHAEAS
ncbi:hypothetical protein [Nocardioides sp. 1609]|uniref:hypothetical protein n=1 Tax=Nocardioides sp. 1609 TaxID=2508327 RepID=UPI00106F4E8E|nr:hypothetical protein [Nocardioides sp. 1609]